ncbi:MAG: hypothetical protein V1909_01050 [Candidatus Micrarchaeota archaeon]
MEIAVAPVSIAGKREDWLVVKVEKSNSDPNKPDVKLELKKHRNPIVKSKFEFTKGELGEDAARLWFSFQVCVIAETVPGVADRFLGKSKVQLTAAELNIEFVSLFRGSILEIENLRLTWDASPIVKTIPKKEVEKLYALAVSSRLPENLTKDVDSQALLLFELLRGSKVSIG